MFFQTKDNNIEMDGLSKNKSYLGYRPKSDNIIKLTQYMRTKGAVSAVKQRGNTKGTIGGASNDPLKNKRF